MLDVTELLPVIGGQRSSTKVSTSPLSIPKALNKFVKAGQEINNMTNNKIDDKEIRNETVNKTDEAVKQSSETTTDYYINNTNDTISVASGDGTYSGDIYYPGDTIGSITVQKDGIKTEIIKENKYPSR